MSPLQVALLPLPEPKQRGICGESVLLAFTPHGAKTEDVMIANTLIWVQGTGRRTGPRFLGVGPSPVDQVPR